MRALRWDGTRLALARDAPDPRPGAGEALVRVHLAGICRTDLEITRGYLGFRGTPGHEWVGHVLAADDPALVGRRVVGEINLGCGVCRSCRAGLGRHCPGRRVLGILGADGAFAELIAVPAANLHPVPETIADREAVFTEPLAAAFEILDQMPSLAGAHAVVLGDGKLGLLVAQVLAGAGAEVVLAGRHETKLARAQALGIRTGPPPPGADLVVDASGAPDGLALALALVRPRGTVVLKTTVAAEHRLHLAPAVINEVTILGSRCGRFPPALAALAEPGTGRVRLLARAGGRQHGDHHRLRVARRRRRAGPASPRLSGRRVEAGVVGHRASPLRAMDARLPAAHDRAGRPADRGHPAAGTRARPACRVTQDEEALLRLLVRLSYFREPGKQFRLASGRTSDYYIECALTTTSPAAIPLIGALG